MDYLRSCYYSSMRLYPDRPDVLVPGRWTFCAPGATDVPWAHAFGSSHYDREDAPDYSLGEVKQRRPRWYRGTPHPRLTGRRVCGTREAWRDGTPYAERGRLVLDADGVPLCCGEGVVIAQGDADGGGGPPADADGWAQAGGGGSSDGGDSLSTGEGGGIALGGDTP